jgi:hypothetical protein
MPPSDFFVKAWTTIAVAALTLLPAAAGAQSAPAPDRDEANGPFSGAVFDAQFRKYTPPRSAFSPFYSWDATMGLDVTVFRHGRHAIDFVSVFESVGTESLGSRIGVGGTGYILGFGYTRTIGDRSTVAAGIQHLSTHLTRDLDQKDREERALGNPIPGTGDRTEYNVLFLRATRTFPAAPLRPTIGVTLDPFNFELNGTTGGYVRPLYLTTLSTLWQAGDRTLALETQHEIGRNPYNAATLRLEMFHRDSAGGRLALLVTAAPGHHLHVSPNIGGRLDGIAAGFSMRFKS